MNRNSMEHPFTPADVVLVVPPFALISQANLACHLLQSCARRRGINVAVVYGNLIYASLVGKQLYREMLEKRLLLEFVFRKHAFGRSAKAEAAVRDNRILQDGAKAAGPWLKRVATIIRSMAPRVVGATCSFEQISASVALLNRCKQVNSAIITLIGGANCEGEMAEGILSLGAQIDFIATGESDETFPSFLETILATGHYPSKIIYGKPCFNLDELPLPVYQEYFDQYSFFLPDDTEALARLALPYESSRGCWWGQKHHCTFCGLNGSTMTFREKSPELVVSELKVLSETYPVTQFNVVDNIMPHSYFTTLLPRLKTELPKAIEIFYEQKANLSLTKVQALKEAHITSIQPGIESLNSHVLKCIDKGIKGSQNIALLRYARSLNVDVCWNLIAGFPGDRPDNYQEMARLIPLIPHLQPPDDLGFLRIDRFSPYFTNPEKYGIAKLRPKSIYEEAFPSKTDFSKLAYYFDGDYQCGAFECVEVLEEISRMTEIWQQKWRSKSKPILCLVRLFGDQFVLTDTRGPEERFDLLDRRQAAVVLTGADLDQREHVGWAIERELLFELDGRLIPLATAPPDLLSDFEDLADRRTRRLAILETPPVSPTGRQPAKWTF